MRDKKLVKQSARILTQKKTISPKNLIFEATFYDT